MRRFSSTWTGNDGGASRVLATSGGSDAILPPFPAANNWPRIGRLPALLAMRLQVEERRTLCSGCSKPLASAFAARLAQIFGLNWSSIMAASVGLSCMADARQVEARKADEAHLHTIGAGKAAHKHGQILHYLWAAQTAVTQERLGMLRHIAADCWHQDCESTDGGVLREAVCRLLSFTQCEPVMRRRALSARMHVANPASEPPT